MGHVRGSEAKWGSTEDQHQGKGPSVGPLPSGPQLCQALLQRNEGGGPQHVHLSWGPQLVLSSGKRARPRSLTLSPLLLAAGRPTWSLVLQGPDLGLVLHGTVLISFALQGCGPSFILQMKH